MEGPRVSGPWLVFRGGNAISVYRPLIYRGTFLLFFLAGDVAAWRASDQIRAAEIKSKASIAWTGVHAIVIKTRA